MEKGQEHKLIEAVEKELMARVLSGELAAGDRLPTERELAAQYGVSRSSVHQAFLALGRAGFLSIVPRRGAVVNDFRKHPSPQSLEALMRYGSIDLQPALFTDMMDTRLWLESECARRACTHIYDSTLCEMRELADRMTQPEADQTDLIYRFHYCLTQASGNSLYSMIFRGFEPVLRSLIARHYTVQADDLNQSVALRYRLLEAIEQKDEDTAVALVRQIIEQGVDVLRKRYE